MKLIIPDNIEPRILERLKEFGEVVNKPKDLVSEIRNAHVLIVRSATKVDKDLLKNATSLKIVARAGVGLDNIDVDECKRRGISVINTPEASSISVAELTIGLMIVMLRKVAKADKMIREGKWNKTELVGKEISGKTLGIMGLGKIGTEVAKRAKAMGMNVIAYDPYVDVSQFASLVELDELLKKSDIISLHLSLTDDTREIINSKTILKMKDGVFFLNMSRGETVNEDDLYSALKSGKIAYAALDVLSKEPYTGKLVDLENIIFSSHTGANTVEAQNRIGEELIEKLRRMVK